MEIAIWQMNLLPVQAADGGESNRRGAAIISGVTDMHGGTAGMTQGKARAGSSPTLRHRPKEIVHLCQDETRDLLFAVIAGCALVAVADGIILPVEKRKMLAVISADKSLRSFDLRGVEAAFSGITARLDQDPAAGRQEALAIVGRMRGDIGQARLCLQACCAVAAADGLLDEGEARMLVAICATLGLDAADLEV